MAGVNCSSIFPVPIYTPKWREMMWSELSCPRSMQWHGLVSNSNLNTRPLMIHWKSPLKGWCATSSEHSYYIYFFQIIFVTALFYLLSISGEQYKPVEWFGKLTATGTSGFGDSAYGAIRSVFNLIFAWSFSSSAHRELGWEMKYSGNKVDLFLLS